MTQISIPAGTRRQTLEVRKSRFIAILGHAATVEQARSFIQAARAEFPDASHVCWAYIAGEPGNTTDLGCSDDGEPAGTAGKPILNVLQHGGFAEIVAVVVRYFGGVKLGTGGLVRAYSGSVSSVIQDLPAIERVAQQALSLECDFALEAAVRHLLDSLDAELVSARYGGQVQLDCRLPESRIEALRERLDDIGRGAIVIHGLPEAG